MIPRCRRTERATALDSSRPRFGSEIRGPAPGSERSACAREAAVEVRHEDVLDIAVRRPVARDACDAELLRQSTLDRSEDALAAAASLRRPSQDLPDPERAQRLGDLPVLLLGGRLSRLSRTAEVAAAGGAALRVGMPALVTPFHMGIALGIARRALDEITQQAIEKGRGFPPSPLPTHPHFQLALGKAELELASARALALQVLSSLWQEARAGRVPQPPRQAEVRAAATYITEVTQRVVTVAFPCFSCAHTLLGPTISRPPFKSVKRPLLATGSTQDLERPIVTCPEHRKKRPVGGVVSVGERGGI